jgi:hypothetical protein
MRDWNALKERYLREYLPTRLGNLASFGTAAVPLYLRRLNSTAKIYPILTIGRLLALSAVLGKWAS